MKGNPVSMRTPTRRRLALLAASCFSVLLVALATAPAQALTSPAAPDSGSSVTVRWTGDQGSAAPYQPARDPQSVHYGDFKDLSVSVSKTTGLTDEVVSVHVGGLPGPTKRMADLIGNPVEYGQNFVQAMQCWGDPSASDFYKNCEWGGNTLAPSSFAPSTAYNNVVGRVQNRSNTDDDSVPFRDVTGAEYSSKLKLVNGQYQLAYSDLFGPFTTNETFALSDSNGSSDFNFALQSAAGAPYLGCGNPDIPSASRCWLVVVPRGEHTTNYTGTCDAAMQDAPNPDIQVGSPVDPKCDYWGNRVVIPMDFRPTSTACASGSTEARTVGSELVQAAFASWQPELCRSTGSAYNFVSVSDLLAREQLLRGTAGLAFINKPLTVSTLATDADKQTLASTQVVYAPVAVSAITVAFRAVSNRVPQTELKLTPRLLAKLVTQSYSYSAGGWEYAADNLGLGNWSSFSLNVSALTGDPEFIQLNPGEFKFQGGNLIVTGPNGSDATAQFWKYLQADDDAREFLSGEPDPWGMRINPYYLPAGHPDARMPEWEDTPSGGSGSSSGMTLQPKRDAAGNVIYRSVGLKKADGSPLCLCDTTQDTFLLSDETMMPRTIYANSAGQTRYDSLSAWPYAPSLNATASRLFNNDTGRKTSWDPSAQNSAGEYGAYVSNGKSNPYDVFLNGITDTPSAIAYKLPTASLQLPNKPGVFASADDSGMGAALGSQVATDVAGVSSTDPAALPDDAYPLTAVTYAAVNLTTSNQQSREAYANLLEYAAGSGQVRGSAPGELPAGYFPLTAEQQGQAAAAAAEIRSFVPPTTAPTPSPSPASAPAPVSAPPVAGVNSVPPVVAAVVPTGVPSVATNASATLTSTESVSAPVGGAIGGALVLGLGGAVAAPFLLRRRSL